MCCSSVLLVARSSADGVISTGTPRVTGLSNDSSVRTVITGVNNSFSYPISIIVLTLCCGLFMQVLFQYFG
jgi:hypothetical protein